MIKKYLTTILLLLTLVSWALADLRAEKLKTFLDRYPWSPLRGHEQEIVYCADKFGIDYRLYVAISGAESTYGKRYKLKNLTGYNNCDTGFESIFQNIYHTSKLIGTAGYYKKFRATNDLWDLIYVYKGVPPYTHYYHNLKYAIDQIHKTPIAAEIKVQRTRLAFLAPPGKKRGISRKAYNNMMTAWVTPQFHKYPIRKLTHLDLKVALR